MNEEMNELMTSLVSELLSDKVGDFFKEILSSSDGDTSLFEPRKDNLEETGMIFKLLNHKFLLKKENNTVSINRSAVLYILEYPKFLYSITCNYNETGRKIAEKLIEKGVSTINGVAKHLPNENLESIIKTFCMMAEDEVIVKATKEKAEKKPKVVTNELLTVNSTVYDEEKKCLREFELNIPKLHEEQVNEIIKSYNESDDKILYLCIEKILDVLYTPLHVRLYRFLQITIESTLFEISSFIAVKPLILLSIASDLVDEGLIIQKENRVYTLNDLFNNIEIIDNYITLLYKYILKIKQDLHERLKGMQSVISKDMQLQFLTKGYTMIDKVNETILCLKYYRQKAQTV